jgi:hypothetical protein
VNCQTKESQVSGLEVLHSAALSRAPVGLVESFLCLPIQLLVNKKDPMPVVRLRIFIHLFGQSL